MPNLSNLVFLPALLAGAIAYLTTPLIIKFSKKLGIIDDPAKHKHPSVIHTRPTPRGGGLAIFLAVAVASLVFLPLDKHLRGILVGASIIALMGFLDDRHNLNPYLRLGVGFLAAGAVVAAGIGISFISNPLGGIIDLSQPQIAFSLFGRGHSIWILSDLFAIFWITFMMNMLNMGAKGIDGQLTAITIAALSLRFSADITQWPVIILASITAGAFLGFLPWHIYPQKIMPGYGGATLAGFLLAVLAILSKFSIRWEGSHVFNPAVFGVVVTQVLNPAAHGAVVHSSLQMAEGFGPGGFTVHIWLVPLLLFASFRARKPWISIPFLIATALLFYFTGLANPTSWNAQGIFTFLEALPWFFAFIIVSEPKTTPFRKKEQVVFGIGIAILSVLPLLIFNFYSHVVALGASLLGNVLYAAYRSKL